MTKHPRRPQPLNSSNWKHFEAEFLAYLVESGNMSKTDDVKLCELRNLIGMEGLKALNVLSFDRPNDSKNFIVVMQKLGEHFDPLKHDVKTHYEFFSRSKRANESIEDYVKVLTAKAKACDFGHLMNTLIRDVLVYHISLEDVRLKESLLLLKERNKRIGIADVTKLYKNYEIDVKSKNQPSMKNVPNIIRCHFCGKMHQANRNLCPAIGKRCWNCNKLGHFQCRCSEPRNPFHQAGSSGEGKVLPSSFGQFNANGKVQGGVTQANTAYKRQVFVKSEIYTLPTGENFVARANARQCVEAAERSSFCNTFWALICCIGR